MATRTGSQRRPANAGPAQRKAPPLDEVLVARIRRLLAGDPGVAEKRMFGGIAFLVQGRMSVGVYGDRLIVRTTPARATEALANEGVEPFDLTGRPMRGWLFVGDPALPDARALARWVHEGVTFARTLPAK